MKKSPWSKGAVFAVALTLVAAAASSALALPPPASFALQAVGGEADERRASSWSMTRVDDGVVTSCGRFEQGDDSPGALFRTADQTTRVAEDGEIPWMLVWSVLWSDEPQRHLRPYLSDWGDETGRVEVYDGEAVHCWGEESKLCVDYELRRVVVVEVKADEVAWRLRSSREGTRLQVTADGRQIARLAVDEGRCSGRWKTGR